MFRQQAFKGILYSCKRMIIPHSVLIRRSFCRFKPCAFRQVLCLHLLARMNLYRISVIRLRFKSGTRFPWSLRLSELKTSNKSGHGVFLGLFRRVFHMLVIWCSFYYALHGPTQMADELHFPVDKTVIWPQETRKSEYMCDVQFQLGYYV